ncbi:Hypothetical predicted protein [Pelobates cultripes]|uniref:Uncharacterized protein n=1 Tax=Pelobates cultripes TaxID=61616 RepID=A0AAD1TI24_PELCU|nr:Hypothetical predicted protein [Pelobates cultripes]
MDESNALCDLESISQRPRVVRVESSLTGTLGQPSLTKPWNRTEDFLVTTCPCGELEKQSHIATICPHSKEQGPFVKEDKGVHVNRQTLPVDKVKRQIFSNTVMLRKPAASTLDHSGKIDRDSQAAPRENNTNLSCGNQGCKSDASLNKPPLRDAVTHNTPHHVKKKHERFPQLSSEPLGKIKQNHSRAVSDVDTFVPVSRYVMQKTNKNKCL